MCVSVPGVRACERASVYECTCVCVRVRSCKTQLTLYLNESVSVVYDVFNVCILYEKFEK